MSTAKKTTFGKKKRIFKNGHVICKIIVPMISLILPEIFLDMSDTNLVFPQIHLFNIITDTINGRDFYLSLAGC